MFNPLNHSLERYQLKFIDCRSLRFFVLYRFQGSVLSRKFSVLSSELVHISTALKGCQHLFSLFLKLFCGFC